MRQTKKLYLDNGKLISVFDYEFDSEKEKPYTIYLSDKVTLHVSNEKYQQIVDLIFENMEGSIGNQN